MAKQIALYRVFISSPDDVSDERSIVEEVISEINPHLVEFLGLSFQPLNWKTDVYPGLSSLGAQGVIDSQIPDDYEIYLGILWKRFGKPTPGVSSGTEHEFKRAFERWQQNHSEIAVMVYFKTSAGDNLDDIDLTQLANIRAFKKALGENALYKDFQTAAQFREFLRTDLMNLARSLTLPSDEKKTDPILVQPVPETEDYLEDEPGFLDLIESGTAAFETARIITGEISDLTKNLTAETKQHTDELNAVHKENKGIKEQKSIINRSGETMLSYAKSLEERTPKLSTEYQKALRDYGQATALLMDFGGDHKKQLQSAYDSVENLENVLADAYQKTSGMRDAISKLPRATSVFNRGKHEATRVIDAFLVEFIQISELTTSVKNSMRDLLKRA